eukprot:6456345-Amphidinium_carterae.1
MWSAVGKVPCLAFAGDEWQLPPPSPHQRSLVHHPQWHFVRKVCMHKVFRQGEDDPLLAKLATLRKTRLCGQEGRNFFFDLCNNHKAWSNHHKPNAADIAHLLQTTKEKTTVITCTRWAAGHINTLAVEVLFRNPGAQQLGTIPADYESNPANYGTDSNLLQQQLAPLSMTLYYGMRIRLTKNMHKNFDYVNGMGAWVLDFNAKNRALIVETETEQKLCIYPITEMNVPVGKLVYYPVKLGYADTVHKYQGAELAHVTFWPDRAGCAAAGYVALSRVRHDADYLLGGIIQCEHFVPAR